jgi:hypothetical protein
MARSKALLATTFFNWPLSPNKLVVDALCGWLLHRNLPMRATGFSRGGIIDFEKQNVCVVSMFQS